MGKTTLLRRIADGLAGLSVGGFFTQEIREHGRRVGFAVETFDGQNGILAHVDRRSGPRIGRYRVDCEEFERIGAAALERATANAAVILIDEIGKMELFSERCRTALAAAFESPKPLVATIMAHRNPLTDELKQRSDVRLIEVTMDNRDRLAGEIVPAIRATCES